MQQANIFTACLMGDMPHVQHLVEHARVNVNAYSPGGWTPLMYAVLGGHPTIVAYLLNQGADVNAPDFSADEEGWADQGTALMAAAADDLIDMLALLLDHGAAIDAQDAQGATALMYAASYANIDSYNYLITRGARQDLVDADGQTAERILQGAFQR